MWFITVQIKGESSVNPSMFQHLILIKFTWGAGSADWEGWVHFGEDASPCKGTCTEFYTLWANNINKCFWSTRTNQCIWTEVIRENMSDSFVLRSQVHKMLMQNKIWLPLWYLKSKHIFGYLSEKIPSIKIERFLQQTMRIRLMGFRVSSDLLYLSTLCLRSMKANRGRGRPHHPPTPKEGAGTLQCGKEIACAL